jgi:DNA-binding transcriptional regulator YiaG
MGKFTFVGYPRPDHPMFSGGPQIYSPHWGHALQQSKNNSLKATAGPQAEKSGPMIEARLFHRCRKALGLSQPAIARALLIASDRTIRRWEQNELTVAGPAWVALEGILRGAGEMTLADRVATVIEQRRQR